MNAVQKKAAAKHVYWRLPSFVCTRLLNQVREKLAGAFVQHDAERQADNKHDCIRDEGGEVFANSHDKRLCVQERFGQRLDTRRAVAEARCDF